MSSIALGRRCLLVLLLAVLAGSIAAPAASAARGLTLGVSGGADPLLFGGSASSRAQWMNRAREAGVGIVRIDVNWYQVAPAKRPPGFVASDPAGPGYDWATVDASVRALAAVGIRPMIEIWGAPRWAEGPHMPARAAPGSWRPSASAFAAFASAIAQRYSGSFPDPTQPGADLPRVALWQGWNEPNLADYLSPAWIRHGRGWRAESPVLYRGLENAFYAAVKAVHGSNFVVDAGTAPYGDPPGGQRIPPVEFDRDLFCLQGAAALKPVRCPNPVHIDALDHHPYGIGGPLQTALNEDDAAVPDYGKLTRVLGAAERAGHVLPRGPKPLWVTEISWDTKPPDPQGVPVQRQARWLEQSLYVLWRQGVDTILWWQLGDAPPIPSFASTYQAGLYYLGGGAKPALTAFRFPFVTHRLDRSSVAVWGRSPQGGQLQIERKRGGRWTVIRRLTVAQHAVFEVNVQVTGSAVLRGQVGGNASLTWEQS